MSCAARARARPRTSAPSLAQRRRTRRTPPSARCSSAWTTRWPAWRGCPRRTVRGCAARARPLFGRMLALALEHYDAAWRYTLAIPRREWRMRLACAWPLLIGQATLEALAAHPNPLAAAPPVKVERSDVHVILAGSTLTVWSNRALAAEAARRR